MQKKLIALAIAGLAAAPAFAQSTNVTMYGLVDAGMEIGNSGFGTKSRIQSGQSAGSRIGFMGEEDLGNGLKAYFQLEAGFALDNGQSTQHGSVQGSTAPTVQGINTGSSSGAQQTTGSYFFQRVAIAGLKGNFGDLSVGRQYTPAFRQSAAIDPFAAGLGGQMPAALGGLPAYNQRYDNSVLYTSPTFSGFSGALMYSSGYENNVNGTSISGATLTTEKAGRAWTIAGQYANGPAFAGLSYQESYGASANIAVLPPVPTDVAKNKSFLVDGSWDFKVVKVSALYATGHADTPGVGRTVDERRWSLGLSAPLGTSSKVQFTYAHKNDRLASDKDAKFWSLGAERSMSKRTALYVAYTKYINENRTDGLGNAVGANWNINSALNTGLQLRDSNYDPYALQFGMRHAF